MHSRCYDRTFHDGVYIVPGRRTHLYYRYICKAGLWVVYSKHIPGSNTNSPTATGCAIQVCCWMRQHESPQAIAALIDRWSNVPV